eukprot:g14825.t1
MSLPPVPVGTPLSFDKRKGSKSAQLQNAAESQKKRKLGSKQSNEEANQYMSLYNFIDAGKSTVPPKGKKSAASSPGLNMDVDAEDVIDLTVNAHPAPLLTPKEEESASSWKASANMKISTGKRLDLASSSTKAMKPHSPSRNLGSRDHEGGRIATNSRMSEVIKPSLLDMDESVEDVAESSKRKTTGKKTTKLFSEARTAVPEEANDEELDRSRNDSRSPERAVAHFRDSSRAQHLQEDKNSEQPARQEETVLVTPRDRVSKIPDSPPGAPLKRFQRHAPPKVSTAARNEVTRSLRQQFDDEEARETERGANGGGVQLHRGRAEDEEGEGLFRGAGSSGSNAMSTSEAVEAARSVRGFGGAAGAAVLRAERIAVADVLRTLDDEDEEPEEEAVATSTNYTKKGTKMSMNKHLPATWGALSVGERLAFLLQEARDVIVDPRQEKTQEDLNKEMLEEAATAAAKNNRDPVKLVHAFDQDQRFGPSIAITRATRWFRAKRLGQNPPLDIFPVLQQYPLIWQSVRQQ